MLLNKGTESWASDPNVHGLRVELSTEHTFLLPYDQFVFAEIEQVDGQQLLRMVFATHEVTVHGHSLRRLVTGLQRRDLAAISLFSDPRRIAAPDGQPVIRGIDVTPLQDSDETPTP